MRLLFIPLASVHPLNVEAKAFHFLLHSTVSLMQMKAFIQTQGAIHLRMFHDFRHDISQCSLQNQSKIRFAGYSILLTRSFFGLPPLSESTLNDQLPLS